VTDRPRLVAAINTLSVSDLNEGTRTLAQGLLPALARVAPEIRQLLVCSQGNRHLFAHDADRVEVDLDHAHVLRRIALDQLAVPRLVRGRADVLVSAAGLATLPTRLPQVMLVSHHFALPSCRDAAGAEGPPRSRRLYYGAPFRLALRRCSSVLAISQFLADGLVRELHADPARVRAMPLGVDPPTAPPVLGGRAPTLLFVGTLYAYKRVDLVIDAFGRARGRLPGDARLVVVGKDPDGTQHDRLRSLAGAAGVADRVDLLGAVDGPELERLYATSSALVLASRYEGFGLPVAEAMSRGTPAMADATSLPEVAGDGGLVVPAQDPSAFADAFVALLTDEPRRLALAERALARGRTLTWDATAEILRDAVHDAAR
jgi:glycosyltransferase involved in cell wall biosynthesis